MSLEFGNIIYLQSKESGSGSELIPGRILWINGDLVALELESSASGLEEHQQALLTYEESHTFVQRSAVIEGVIDREAADHPDESHLLAMDLPKHSRRRIGVFRLEGQPVLAESRDCFRVKTHEMELYVDFGNRTDCELVDISQSGFAVISDEEFEISRLVKATMPGRHGIVSGISRIQSRKQLRSRRHRYGVVAIGSELREACAYLALEFQRRRLRRLAGHC